MELLTFRPRAGVADDEVRACEERVYQRFAMHQPGMMRRTTARSADGEWLVVQLWGDEASADAAAEAAGADPDVAALHALADPASLSTRRYEDLGG